MQAILRTAIVVSSLNPISAQVSFSSQPKITDVVTRQEQIRAAEHLKEHPPMKTEQQPLNKKGFEKSSSMFLPENHGKVEHIVGGAEATPFARPWMVSLQYSFGGLSGSFHYCGGALIAPDVVSLCRIVTFVRACTLTFLQWVGAWEGCRSCDSLPLLYRLTGSHRGTLRWW